MYFKLILFNIILFSSTSLCLNSSRLKNLKSSGFNISKRSTLDKCDTTIDPSLGKGVCMSVDQCDGVYVHNWCMSKPANIKCCFKGKSSNDLCRNGANFLPHSDPKKFIQCAHGTAFIFDCPPGLVWHQDKSWCDFPDIPTIPIIPDITEIDEIDPVDEIQDLLPEIEDIEDFFDNLIFPEAKKDRCDTENHPEFGRGICKEMSECDGLYVNNWCLSKPSSVKCCFENQKDWDNICKKGGQLYPHKEPNKYIHCAHGLPVVKECPTGQIWTSEKQYCDYPPKEETNSANQIDNELVSLSFLSLVEGFKTTAYCLKDFPESGVTIGIGVDLGQNSYEELKKIGVDEKILNKLKSYFGLKGKEACEAVAKEAVELTNDEAFHISSVVKRQKNKEAQNYYDSSKAANSKPFDQLTCAQRTVIASVLYQYGSPKRVPAFWKNVINNDWVKVVGELRDFKDAHDRRRNQEADLIEFDSGKKECSSPNDDICKITSGSCIGSTKCKSKVAKGFCQKQPQNVICCISTTGGEKPIDEVSEESDDKVALIREHIATEAINAAHAASQNRCAEYVRKAIERAYSTVTKQTLNIKRVNSAKDYGPSLLKVGFKKVTEPLQKGDVVIFPAVGKHKHGHMAVYTGTSWVSDFKQKSMYVSKAYLETTPTFYRYYEN